MTAADTQNKPAPLHWCLRKARSGRTSAGQHVIFPEPAGPFRRTACPGAQIWTMGISTSCPPPLGSSTGWVPAVSVACLPSCSLSARIRRCRGRTDQRHQEAGNQGLPGASAGPAGGFHTDKQNALTSNHPRRDRGDQSGAADQRRAETWAPSAWTEAVPGVETNHSSRTAPGPTNATGGGPGQVIENLIQGFPMRSGL